MKKSIFTLISIILISITTNVSHAGNRDTVRSVYSCNDDIIIAMDNAGFVAIRESQVGQKRLERMFSIAMTLLVTQNPTGFFNNNGTPMRLCGIDSVTPITVLAINRD